MSHQIFSSIKLYTIVIAVICGWWYLAFKPAKATAIELAKPKTEIPLQQQLPSLFTSIDRKNLHRALSGDYTLMANLIAEWDLDSQVLTSQGLDVVKRLSPEAYLRSQILARQLKNSSPQQLQLLHTRDRAKQISDDHNNTLDLGQEFQRFLPQTYVAASFLLALVEPEQIVALPQGLRDQAHLFPCSLTSKISLDINRYNSEKLYQKRPEVAFVAHYSHPATIQALSKQGIHIFTMKALDTLEEVNATLQRIGHVANRSLEAELLTLFIEASLLAIDNQFIFLHYSISKDQTPPPRLLFLNYYARYSVPTAKTLTGQLLQRIEALGYTIFQTQKEQQHEWMVPIEQEAIANFSPSCILIATANSQVVKGVLQDASTFAHLSTPIFLVDEAVQQSPSQYIVLAYYDIFHALKTIIAP